MHRDRNTIDRKVLPLQSVQSESKGRGNIERSREEALLLISLLKRTILAGNMNAHHPWWNSKTRRHRNSANIILIAEKADLDLINQPDIPMYIFARGEGRSMMDLAFSTLDITKEIQNWPSTKNPNQD